MEAILLQILNGLDKGSAYALIALGLTLIFGTLGVVNFAHGALFMIGAFCAVTFSRLLTLSYVTEDADPERLSRQSAQGRDTLCGELVRSRVRIRDDRLGRAAVDPVCDSGHDCWSVSPWNAG
jgi:ABC-type branched-subunit amino acid transport system permease subunit